MSRTRVPFVRGVALAVIAAVLVTIAIGCAGEPPLAPTPSVSTPVVPVVPAADLAGAWSGTWTSRYTAGFSATQRVTVTLTTSTSQTIGTISSSESADKAEVTLTATGYEVRGKATLRSDACSAVTADITGALADGSLRLSMAGVAGGSPCSWAPVQEFDLRK
jgi:hypothetical protein